MFQITYKYMLSEAIPFYLKFLIPSLVLYGTFTFQIAQARVYEWKLCIMIVLVKRILRVGPHSFDYVDTIGLEPQQVSKFKPADWV